MSVTQWGNAMTRKLDEWKGSCRLWNNSVTVLWRRAHRQIQYSGESIRTISEFLHVLLNTSQLRMCCYILPNSDCLCVVPFILWRSYHALFRFVFVNEKKKNLEKSVHSYFHLSSHSFIHPLIYSFIHPFVKSVNLLYRHEYKY